jgi:hypothetical protein
MLGEFPAGRASSGFFLVFAFYLASPERHEVYRRGVESFPSELDRREKRERNFSFLAPLSAESRRIRSQWRAQANSVARGQGEPAARYPPEARSSRLPIPQHVVHISAWLNSISFWWRNVFHQDPNVRRSFPFHP